MHRKFYEEYGATQCELTKVDTRIPNQSVRMHSILDMPG